MISKNSSKEYVWSIERFPRSVPLSMVLKAFYNHITLFLSVGLIYGAVVRGLPYLFLMLNSAVMTDWQAVQEGHLSMLFLMYQHALYLSIAFLVYSALFAVVYIGLVQVYFDVHDKGSSSIKRLFSHFKSGSLIVRSILINSFALLLSFACMIPLVIVAVVTAWIFGGWKIFFLVGPILIIALFYVLARISFMIYAFVGNKVGVVDTVSYSMRITSGNVLRIFGLWTLSAMIIAPFNFFGPIISYVAGGLLGTVVGLALTYAYRKLSPEFPDRIEPSIDFVEPN